MAIGDWRLETRCSTGCQPETVLGERDFVGMPRELLLGAAAHDRALRQTARLVRDARPPRLPEFADLTMVRIVAA
jgi:hypothetical protein